VAADCFGHCVVVAVDLVRVNDIFGCYEFGLVDFIVKQIFVRLYIQYFHRSFQTLF
jgi:hypothetical protein